LELREFTVIADASDLGCGAVLMQLDKVIAYYSKKFSPAELNYTVGEKELLALINACKEWRCYLEGARITLVTDHHPLVFLTSQAVLSRRQARWLEFLSRFDYNIQYQKGEHNTVADTLSRHPTFTSAAMIQTRSQRRRAEASGSSRGEEATVVTDNTHINNSTTVDICHVSSLEEEHADGRSRTCNVTVPYDDQNDMSLVTRGKRTAEATHGVDDAHTHRTERRPLPMS
jgi:hypothetical protein